MMAAYEWTSPDREGFDALMAEPFVRIGTMVFVKSHFNRDRVTAGIKDLGEEGVQREINHTHLILYCPELETQREWARELKQRWSARLREEHPDLASAVEVQDSGEEVIVTFWCETKA